MNAHPLVGRFGTWVKLPAIESIQILAHAGWDFVVVDQEHAPIDDRSMYQLVSIASSLGVLPLVRVDGLRGPTIQRVLDAGAAGVLIPHVDTAEHAAEAVRAVRFPPVGRRGAGATSRAGRWGTRPLEHYLDEGDRALCIPQIESAAAVENVEAILAIPGIDAIFLGVADLALDMGRRTTDPEVVAMSNAVLGAARSHGVPCGFAAGSGAGAAAAHRAGFGFVMASSDTALLANAAIEVLAQARAGASATSSGRRAEPGA